MGAAKRFRQRVKSQRKESREALYGKLVGPNVGLQDFIKTAMQQTLGVSAVIKLVEPRSLPRSEGKAVRVIDNRHI